MDLFLECEINRRSEMPCGNDIALLGRKLPDPIIRSTFDYGWQLMRLTDGLLELIPPIHFHCVTCKQSSNFVKFGDLKILIPYDIYDDDIVVNGKSNSNM